MDLIDPAHVAARARAALAYANIEVKDSKDRIGIPYSTMTRIVSPKNPRGARTVEELWAIADACGVPRAFMERGFEVVVEAEEAARVNGAANDLEDVLRRVAALEQATGLQ